MKPTNPTMKKLARCLSACALIVLASLGAGNALAFDPAPSARVLRIMVEADGSVLIGGYFTQVGGQPHNHIARLSADGTVFEGYPETDGNVHDGVIQPDGKVLFGGAFSHVDGQPYQGVVRIDVDDSVDSDFAPPTLAGGVGRVEALALQPDGDILVGGSFNTFNGQPGGNISRLKPDGTVDAGFTAATEDFGNVYAVAVQDDGKILIGGSFNTVNAQAQAKLARLNADGSLDAAFAPAVTLTVEDILVQADGKILLAGGAGMINGENRSGIARLESDGTLDGGFAPDIAGPPWSNNTYSLVLQPDGKILVGGDIWTVDGESRRGIARINPDGSLDASFVDPQIPDETPAIRSVALQPDGKILIGGGFTGVGGHPRNNMARLNADGTLDVDLFTVTPSPGSNGTITPSDPQFAAGGDILEFTVQPDSGYRIETVSGCGGSLSGVTYTTFPISEDCTITATFVEGAVLYMVEPGAGDNGTLTPDEPQTAEFGQVVIFEVQPDPGFYTDQVDGCGGTLEGSTYTTAPVTAHCQVTASFTSPYRIEAVDGAAQVATVNTPFVEPLVVRVTNNQNNPVAGVEVTLSAPTEGASAILSESTVITDADGVASVTVSANGIAGNYTVAAAIDCNFCFPEAEFSLGNEDPESGGVELVVTVSTDPPPACGSATEIEIPAGEPVNYCFTLTNHTGVPQELHSIIYDPADAYFAVSDEGVLFSDRSVEIPPGHSHQINRVFKSGPRLEAGEDGQHPVFTWYSRASGSPDAVQRQSSAGVDVHIGTPELALTFDAIEVQGTAGDFTPRVSRLAVANQGDFPLEWQIEDSSSPQNVEAPMADPADSLFDVPVYGMKLEEGVNFQKQPVMFDAAALREFSYLERVCAVGGDVTACGGGIAGGDFAGDDFSRWLAFDGLIARPEDASDFSLSWLDTRTGEYDHIGWVYTDDPWEPPYTRWSGLSWDRATGTMYAVAKQPGDSPPYNDCQDRPATELYVIDPDAMPPELRMTAERIAAVTVDGEPTCIADIAVHPLTGTMYGIDISADTLVVIDKNSGAATTVGPLGIDLFNNNNNSVDFDDVTGTLYLSAYQNLNYDIEGGLYTINTDTAVAVLVSRWPVTNPDARYIGVSGMAIARAVGCGPGEDPPWLSLDVLEGSVAPGEHSTVSVNLSAANLEPGLHEAELCLQTNDRAHPVVILPVRFDVAAPDGEQPGDPIFRDRFQM